MKYKKSDIILVPFPFTDESGSKRRPGLIIKCAKSENYTDYIILAITSQIRINENRISISNFDIEGGELKKNSQIILTKVYTINEDIIIKSLEN